MLLFSLFFSWQCFAETKRVESRIQDLGSVQKIYLSNGLISVLEFPQSIIEVRNGNPGTLKTAISQVSQKELTVYLSGSNQSPTNLIVRADRKIYLFDIIPSKTKHQDYVQIRGSYGSPGMSEQPTAIDRQTLGPTDESQKPKTNASIRVSL